MRFYTYVQDERSEIKFINLVRTLCKWCDTTKGKDIPYYRMNNAVFCLKVFTLSHWWRDVRSLFLLKFFQLFTRALN